jgi:two-component system LytT family sensor kinase
MLHPILSQKRVFFSYLAGWIILILVHAIFLHNNTFLSLQMAFGDAIIYNCTFMILALALYFPLAFPENCTTEDRLRKSLVYNILHHVITALVTMTIWLGSSFLLGHLFLGQNDLYIDFVQKSLPIRATIGSLLLLLIILMYHFFGFYKHLEEKTLREEQLKKMVKEAELKALKAQLNPHFLINSLNSISSLTISDPPGAREMLTQLSDFLRYSLRKNDESLLPLSEEIKNMKRYLEIEKVRFGNRLDCNFEIPEACYQSLVPAMLLQPIYENAIKHGLYESMDPITITTTGSFRETFLEVSIKNNYDPESTPIKGEGVGLENVRNKLNLFYSRSDLLSITRNNDIFEVKFFLPEKYKS